MKRAMVYETVARGGVARAEYERLRLLALPVRPAPPRFGKTQIPRHAFASSREAVARAHFSSSPRVLTTFCWLHETWDRLGRMRFVETRLPALLWQRGAYADPADGDDALVGAASPAAGGRSTVSHWPRIPPCVWR